MTLAALFIFTMEIFALRILECKYHRAGEESISVEEFIARASFDDILRHRFHALTAWIALGIMTIASTWRP